MLCCKMPLASLSAPGNGSFRLLVLLWVSCLFICLPDADAKSSSKYSSHKYSSSSSKYGSSAKKSSSSSKSRKDLDDDPQVPAYKATGTPLFDLDDVKSAVVEDEP